MKNIKLAVLFFVIFLIVSCTSRQSAFQKNRVFSEDPMQILELLKQGNDHFVHHENCFPNLDKKRMLEEVREQHPIATIVSCSDSRVPVELVFDRGIGDLFVIRTAGNSLDDDMTMGSLEYGVGHLHTKLIIVVGHEKCGGVTAAISDESEENVPKEIAGLVATLRKGVYSFVGKTDKLEEAIHQNVDYQIQKISQNPEFKELIDRGELKVVGAYYHLEDGRIDFLN